nr:NADH dehydrogenase subunit 6 [Citharichthys spilopterus]
MMFVMNLTLVCLVLGVVAVASNPSPYFAALGLVVVAGMGCGLLAGHGGSFLCFILFLIYLGGMLVVFGYSAALAAEPYPETLGSWRVLARMLGYVVGLLLLCGVFWGDWQGYSWVVVDEVAEDSVSRGDEGGVAGMFSLGGWMLLMCAWALLLTLLVVLELTRGSARGPLRHV